MICIRDLHRVRVRRLVHGVELFTRSDLVIQRLLEEFREDGCVFAAGTQKPGPDGIIVVRHGGK